MKQKYHAFLGLLVWLAGLGHAAADSLVLDWNPGDSPVVTGYFIYYGTNSGSYPNKIDAGNVTSFTLTNLAAGVTYYFTATAYDANGNESVYSNETSFVLAGVLIMSQGENPGDPSVIQFPVEPGHWYEVQATTDFQSWSTIWQTEVADSNTWLQFTDPDAGAYAARFYRLVLH
jgi:hypothetical protein